MAVEPEGVMSSMWAAYPHPRAPCATYGEVTHIRIAATGVERLATYPSRRRDGLVPGDDRDAIVIAPDQLHADTTGAPGRTSHFAPPRLGVDLDPVEHQFDGVPVSGGEPPSQGSRPRRQDRHDGTDPAPGRARGGALDGEQGPVLGDAVGAELGADLVVEASTNCGWSDLDQVVGDAGHPKTGPPRALTGTVDGFARTAGFRTGTAAAGGPPPVREPRIRSGSWQQRRTGGRGRISELTGPSHGLDQVGAPLEILDLHLVSQRRVVGVDARGQDHPQSRSPAVGRDELVDGRQRLRGIGDPAPITAARRIDVHQRAVGYLDVQGILVPGDDVPSEDGGVVSEEDEAGFVEIDREHRPGGPREGCCIAADAAAEIDDVGVLEAPRTPGGDRGITRLLERFAGEEQPVCVRPPVAGSTSGRSSCQSGCGPSRVARLPSEARHGVELIGTGIEQTCGRGDGGEPVPTHQPVGDVDLEFGHLGPSLMG